MGYCPEILPRLPSATYFNETESWIDTWIREASVPGLSEITIRGQRLRTVRSSARSYTRTLSEQSRHLGFLTALLTRDRSRASTRVPETAARGVPWTKTESWISDLRRHRERAPPRHERPGKELLGQGSIRVRCQCLVDMTFGKVPDQKREQNTPVRTGGTRRWNRSVSRRGSPAIPSSDPP